MKKYYEDAKNNAAFDRCIDVMTRMIEKYGHLVLKKQTITDHSSHKNELMHTDTQSTKYSA